MRSVSRRSMLSLAAGLMAVFTTRAKAQAPAMATAGGFPFSRGMLVPMATRVVDGEVCIDLNSPCIEQISTGEKLVPLHSQDGQAALHSRMALPDDPWPAYPRGKRLGHRVSTGEYFVIAQSPEGIAVLKSTGNLWEPTPLKIVGRLLPCLALALLLASPAFAQAPTDKVPLTVTRAELQVIGQGLMELPYKTSASVMNDLQAQLNAADQAAAKAAADAVKPKEEKPADGIPQTPAGVTPN